MAGEGTTIATAWVQLAFSATGVKKQIQDELDGSAGASDIGDRTGKSFLGGLSGALAGVGKVAAVTLAAIGTAAAGAAIKGISAFTDFQGQMNEVFSLIPDAGQETFDSLSKNVKDFAKEFGVLPEKVVPALYESLSSGVPTDNVFAFLEVAQKAARGGVTELTTTVDGLTSVINAYGAGNIDAARASDIMFTAVKLGKTTFAELSASLFNVNPAAAAVGLRFEEVSGALAHMTAQGVPTSVATTQIRSAIVELTQGAGKAGKAFTEIAGKSFPEFVKGGGTLQEALNLMRTEADNTGTSLLDMFGSVEGGQAGLALTGDNAAGFAKALDAMNTSTGATDQAFNQLSKGLGPIFDKIKAGAQVFLIDLGEKLAPAVEAGIGKFMEIMARAKEIAIPILDTIILAFKALVSAFKDPDVTSDGLVGVFEKIGVFARQVFDVIRSIDFKAIFAGVIEVATPVIEALSKLGGSVLNLVVESFKTLKKLFDDNRETLKTFGEKVLEVGNFLKNVFVGAVNILSGTFNFLASNMEAVKAIAVPLLAAFVAYKTVMLGIQIVTTAVAAATRMYTAVQAALNVVMSLNPIGILIAAITALVAGVIYAYTHFEGFRNVIDSVGDAIQWVYNWVKDNWQTILALLAGPVGVAVLLVAKHWDTIKEAVSAMVDGVKGFVGNFIQFFKDLPGNILEAIGNFHNLLVDKGVDLIIGLHNGVVNTVSRVLNFFTGLRDSVISWLGDVTSWLFNKGSDLLQGLINGVYSLFTGLATIWWNLSTNIVSWIGNVGSWLYNTGRDLMQGLINGVIDIAGNLTDAVLAPVKNAVGAVKGFLGIGSPSKLFMGIGEDTMLGLQIGIDKNPPKWLMAAPDPSTFASPGLAGLRATGGAIGPLGGMNGSGGGAGVVLNQTNNTNADPGEIAAATAFRLITSGAI